MPISNVLLGADSTDALLTYTHMSRRPVMHAQTKASYSAVYRPCLTHARTPGQQRHCTKSDHCPACNYHITAKPGRRCSMLIYKEFVLDLRESAAVWN